MKVLVVTTDERVSLQVANALVDGVDDEQVAILEVRTPSRAMRVLEEHLDYDVVLADADTAPSGGFVLSRDMKAAMRMEQRMPPIVLLIARDQDKFLAKWAEADAFIRKPADPFDLAEVVDAVVKGEKVPTLPGVGATEDLPEVLQVPSGQEPGSVGQGGP